jgi:hypothetical protein
MVITNEALTLKFEVSKNRPYRLTVGSQINASKQFTFDVSRKIYEIKDVLAVGDTILGYYGSGNPATTFTVASITETHQSLVVVVNEAVAQTYHTMVWTKANTTTKAVVKEQIRDVVKDDKNQKIYLSLLARSNEYANDVIEITFADVTIPVAATLDQLYALIILYIETQAMLTSIRSDTTDAINLVGGPYTITFDTPLGTADYTVIAVDENDGAIKVDISSITINGFQFDCVPIPGVTTAIVHYHCIVKTES